MALPNLYEVRLVYRGAKYGDPPSSQAVCQCRITPARFVVVSGEVTEGRQVLGGLPYIFDRESGSRRPHLILSRTWGLAEGEKDRLNALVKGNLTDE